MHFAGFIVTFLNFLKKSHLNCRQCIKMLKNLRNPLRRPTHPGAILREDILPALAISQSALAEYLGVSRLTVSEILLEKRSISAEMALRISKTVGGSPESWLQMQSAVDLWDVAQRFKANPKKLPRPIPNYAFA
jgi:addiction module HigA family antidote